MAMPMGSSHRGRVTLGGALGTAGGVVLLLAPLLVWLSGSVRRIGGRPGRTISARGVTIVSGKVALAMGVALVVAGLIVWLSSRDTLRRAMAIVAVVAGTVAASFVLARMATIANQADVAARNRRLQVARVVEPGMYLALLGGLTGLAGGVVALTNGTERPSDPSRSNREADPLPADTAATT